MSNLTPSQDGERKRPETHQLMKDADTGEYYIKIANGNVYPLSDPMNPDADAIVRGK